ncbi:MAG: pyridoxamine 5'-phosphate oxidase family protein [Actinomycetota bacterium]|nr:pyridoxamine 5'-phosphate oxidase family protein [Actinomycetota bacterium]
MSSWVDVEAAEPDFSSRVRSLFDARKHKTIATLRRDGSPRISGIEVEFSEGEVWLGMMPDSVKSRDLRRDPRLALHSASEDPPEDDPSRWPGDAKISGVAVEAPNPQGPGPPANRFRIDIREIVLTRVGEPADHLVIESWHPDRGLERRHRR